MTPFYIFSVTNIDQHRCLKLYRHGWYVCHSDMCETYETSVTVSEPNETSEQCDTY